MPKVKYSGMISKRGSSAGETYATMQNGDIIVRKHTGARGPLNEEQKSNASGFSEIARHKRYLGHVLRVSMPPDSDGKKWGNRFTMLNRKKKEVVTTTKNEPGPVNPARRSTDEFTSTVNWEELILAEGPLWKPRVTVTLPAYQEGQDYKLLFEQEASAIEGAYAYADDKVYAVVYSPVPGNYFCLLARLRPRGESGSTTVQMPADVTPETLKIYTFATTADGRATSNSAMLPAPLP